MAFYDPKIDIFNKLEEIQNLDNSDATILEENPKITKVMPCIIYKVANNTPVMEVAGTYSIQDIEIEVNIFGDDSDQTAHLMSQVVDKLLELKYRCIRNLDIPDPDGYSHVNMGFVY